MNKQSNKNAVIYPNVKLGKNYRLDIGVILGFSEDVEDTDITIIGKNAIFRVHTVVYAGVKIGDNFQTGPGVFIRENNVIGNNVAVWHGTTLSPGNVIGDGCRIHAGSFLELTTLGKRVFVGPNVVFADDPHPVNPSPRTHFGGAVIEDEAVIGANVTVLPHIRVGKRAVVGAGSMVTKDIPAGEVWVGNPARFLKKAKDIVCYIENRKHYPYREYWKIK